MTRGQRMAGRKTYAPAEALRVDELRAEARAWRRAAERYDRDPSWHCYTPYGAFSRYVWEARLGRPVDDSGYGRNGGHVSAAGGYAFTFYRNPQAVILACLFLALECEDEARSSGHQAAEEAGTRSQRIALE